MYLWMNAEGWVRFGPFGSLRFVDAPRVILDQDDRVVASHDGAGWRAAEGRRGGLVFRDPMVTAGPEHPHPDQG